MGGSVLIALGEFWNAWNSSHSLDMIPSLCGGRLPPLVVLRIALIAIVYYCILITFIALV